jgi:hypothetical protein
MNIKQYVVFFIVISGCVAMPLCSMPGRPVQKKRFSKAPNKKGGETDFTARQRQLAAAAEMRKKRAHEQNKTLSPRREPAVAPCAAAKAAQEGNVYFNRDTLVANTNKVQQSQSIIKGSKNEVKGRTSRW